MCAVHRVPATVDLFGEKVPGHYRYTVQYADGRWANDRRHSDLEAAPAG